MVATNKGLLRSLLILSVSLLVSCGGNDTGKTAGTEKTAVKPAQDTVMTPDGHENKAPKSPSPVASSGSPQDSVTIIPENPTVASTLQAVFSGATGSLNYRWERNGELIDRQGEERLDGKSFKKGDEIRVVVSANGKEYDSTTVIVNALPAIAGVTISPLDVWSGKDVSVDAEGKDPDGDTITFDYQWLINGEEVSMQNDLVLKGDQFKRGDNLTVKVVPSDGSDRGKPFTPPSVVVGNAPPKFTSTSPREFSSRSYSYQTRAVDPDGDPMTFSLAKAPEGMVISGDGNITWSIQMGTKGTFDVSVIADDGQGGKATQNYQMTIGPAEQ